MGLVQIQNRAGGETAWCEQDTFDRIWAAKGYWIVGPGGTILTGRATRDSIHAGQAEGQFIIAFGHSWVALDLQNVAGGNPVERFAARCLADPTSGVGLLNQALGGTGVDSAADRAIGDVATYHHVTPNVKALFWVDCFINQMGYAGYTDVNAKASIINNLRALMATICTAARVEETAMTKGNTGGGGGSWATVNSNRYSNGHLVYTSTNNDWIEGPVTVLANGIVDIFLRGIVPADAPPSGWPFPGADFEVTVDGVVVATNPATTNAQHINWAGTENQADGSLCVTLRGVTPGVRTVRVRKKAGAIATAYLYFDYMAPRRVTGPPTVLWKCPRLPWPSLYVLYHRAPLFHFTTQAEVDAMNADVVTMVTAEFPNVIVIDPDANGWDPLTMLGADALHMNDRGAAFMTNLAEYTVSKLVPWNSGIGTGMTP